MLDFWLWVYSLDGVGSKGVSNLIARHGKYPDVRRVIADLRKMQPGLAGVGEWKEKAEEIAAALRSRQVEVLPSWDSAFPERLREIPDAPVFLFYKGDPGVLSMDHAISVVGTRSMSEYGRQCARDVVSGLLHYDVAVISGLAFGIDSEAHRAMSDVPEIAAKPVGVLPGGPCGGYPHANRDVYDFILENGCAVWEFLPGTQVKPELFAVRNRIIAGLSTCTFVVESPESGGSMITASLALQYGRDVAACPGSIYSDTAVGSNDLIRSGAYLISSGQDVLRVLDPGREEDAENGAAYAVEILADSLSETFSLKKTDAGTVALKMKEGSCTLDMLSDTLGKDASEVRICLTMLEVKGILRLKSDGKIKIDI